MTSFIQLLGFGNDGGVILMFGNAVMRLQCGQMGLSTHLWGSPVWSNKVEEVIMII